MLGRKVPTYSWAEKREQGTTGQTFWYAGVFTMGEMEQTCGMGRRGVLGVNGPVVPAAATDECGAMVK
jgi:hypothetical protein